MQLVSLSGTGLLILIAGSAALLLWGARMTRTGIIRAFGQGIGEALSKGTNNRFKACLVGLIAASVLQSSTAVSVLLVSFASSGAISTSAGLAILLGADVGSALVAQLLSLKIHQFWPCLFFLGYVLHAAFSVRNPMVKQAGRICMGLGLVFLSLNTLASTAAVFQGSNLIKVILVALANEPAIAFIVAAALTWIAHSSLAILLLLVVIANTGLLESNFLSFYLVLGINAGAGLPALVLGLFEKPPARRILVGNFIIRSVTAIIASVTLAYWSGYFSVLDVDPGQKLIILHVTFNIFLAMTFLWLTNPLSWQLRTIIPDANNDVDSNVARHLDPSTKNIPSLALSAASRETLRMVGVVEEMLSQAIEMLTTNNSELRQSTAMLDDKVDRLYRDIKFFLTDLTQRELQESESARALEILSFTINLEHAGDIIVRSLLGTIKKKTQNSEGFSKKGFKELMEAYKHVGETIHFASKVFMEKEISDAHDLLHRKETFRNLELESIENHLSRLANRDPGAIATTAYHTDILQDLKRINSLFISCAYPLLEDAGRLHPSRLKKM